MKEDAIKKINTFGKVGAIIAKVIRIFLYIGVVGTLIGTIALAVLPKNLLNVKLTGKAAVVVNIEKFGTFKEKDKEQIRKEIQKGSIDINGSDYGVIDSNVTDTTIEIDAQTSTRVLTLHDLIPILVVAMLAIIMSLVTAYFAGSLCKAFRYCASPFEENVIRKMRNLAFSLIPWALISSFTNSFIAGYFAGSTDFSVGINMSVVIAILIILALTYIFKYGAVLQKESDETL